MPIDYKQYPDDWPLVRRRILRRAGGQYSDPRIGARCEICGVRNYSVIKRHRNGLVSVIVGDCNSYREASSFRNKSEGHIVVVLTIAHMGDMNPHACDDDNLKALCQRCHNAHDAQYRAANRKRKRHGKDKEK